MERISNTANTPIQISPVRAEVPTGISRQAKISAAWLIENAGLKGHSIGGAQVSKQHALVLINRKRATGQELWQLAEFVMQTVKQRFGVQLEPEPLII